MTDNTGTEVTLGHTDFDPEDDTVLTSTEVDGGGVEDERG